MSPEPVAVAEAFVRAISRQNVDEMADLMTADHVFVDSDGAETRGKEPMCAGWAWYFQMFPDYKIEVQETYSRGQVVVLVGTAEGTYAVDGELLAENHWSVPAVWRAVARDAALSEWRVYVNVEPIAKIVAKHRK
jgi:ketosteroid isomerase-like protein